MFDRPIRQVAYFVPDVRRAAMTHHELYGSGPYFVADNIPLRVSRYRGADCPLDHTSAYGQWGEIMIEFVQQNNAGPSAFHDLYPEGSGMSGIHHVALFVENVMDEIARFNAAGHATALYAEMNDGFAFAMMDCVTTLGHMVELYVSAPQLVDFYNLVASSAKDFKGGDVLTSVTF
jgi:Glyoxalase/Bleomycin resistance protein/Dioxygenase superfamily